MSSINKHLFIAVSALAFGVVGGFTSAEASGDRNEVWVSSTNSGGWIPPLGYTNLIGLGSVSNPYSVSNIYYGNYDAIICSLPTNTTIHLLPGVFYSKGYVIEGVVTNNPYLKAGQRLIGAGRDISIIRRTDPANVRLTMVEGIGENIEMSDFTVDAGANDTDSYKAGLGIWNYGGGCMRRIKVINTCGNGWECFSINNGAIGGTGSVIEECEVSSVRGTRVSAITLGGHGIVRNCRVYFPVVTSFSQGTFQAYMGHFTSSAIFDGNLSDGGSVGYYSDTGGDTNLTIINNSFLRPVAGIELVKLPGNGYIVDGATIQNNTVQISTNIPETAYYWTYCLAISLNDTSGNEWFRNISVIGNTFQYYGNGGKSGQYNTKAVQFYSALRTNMFNVRVLANTFDRTFSTRFDGYGNWLSGNMDQIGNPFDFRKITGTTGTVYLDEPDATVIVASSSTTGNLVFSHSWGFPNMEVVVMNQKSGSSVQVYAATGESISGSATVSSGQTARFLSDGNGTWTRESF